MIGWYVHHHGRGHLTRAHAVARSMRTPVTGLSSLAKPPGWSGPWVDLPRDDDLRAGEATRDVDAHGVLHWAPLRHQGLAVRTAHIATWVASARPALVVVDVSVEVSLLVRLCGVPVVVVALPGMRQDRPHRAAYDVADVLLGPWPTDTHTADWPSSWQEKVRCVGGISQFDGCAVPPVHRRSGQVLLLWGSGGRQVVPAEVDAARAATPGWTWVERSPARPSPDLWRELHESEVVVTHGGQNAVADVAASRSPAIVVAQDRPFGEQRATVRAIDRLGVGVGVDRWPRPEAWTGLLGRARGLGGARWGEWSSGHGAQAAGSLLDALAARSASVTVRA